MNKITICGKGGSGKSTVTALLAKALREKLYSVLVVDSDESNTGLHRMLGFEKAPLSIMDMMGGRKNLKEKLPPKSPKGLARTQTDMLSGNEIRIDSIPQEYINYSDDGIALIGVGKINEAMEGCACPIGALGKELLAKLYLEAGQIVLIDMEAGIEHFGRGVEAGVDAVLIVVDPSYESLDLAGRINRVSAQMQIDHIYAILNKVTSKEMAANLTEKLGNQGVRVIGNIRYDQGTFRAGLEGHLISGNIASKDGGDIVTWLLKGKRINDLP
jgi:CO dehydrogenase maturation factor